MYKIFILCVFCIAVPLNNYKGDFVYIKQSLSLMAIGDALLHSYVYNDAKNNNEYDFSSMLTFLKPIVKSHNLAFYNQETILGGKELGLSSYPSFNSPQEFGINMLDLGFNLVSLANNHTLDRGERAIKNSLRFWSDKGILYAGSYESFEDRNKERIFYSNGISYSMLAYTYGTNGIPLKKGREYLVNVYNKDMLKQDIQRIRPKVDLLIVSMHWGNEYEFNPTKEQREFAAYLSSLGVDIIIGHHSHVIAPVEFIGKTLVIYSLGNFISAQQKLDNKIGLLVSLNLTKKTRKSPLDEFVLKDISIDEVNLELLYTYNDSNKQKFAVYPFHKLNDSILQNHKSIYDKYIKIACKNPMYNTQNYTRCF